MTKSCNPGAGPTWESKLAFSEDYFPGDFFFFFAVFFIFFLFLLVSISGLETYP
jgi:hypothetical protein